MDIEQAFEGSLPANLNEACAAWTQVASRCTHCGSCQPRCELLKDRTLDIGTIASKGQELFATVNKATQAQQGELDSAALKSGIRRFIAEEPSLYQALRECCFCNHCTATCPVGMVASQTTRPWRQLFALSGDMPEGDSKIVSVDKEWHIFSVYRAVYGIAYPEFYDLASLEPGQVDTLFFPGCALVSYMPELVSAVGTWLNAQGFVWALSQSCCGSPLMSAGLIERSRSLRLKLLGQIRHGGIKQVITVCPGCDEELSEVFGDEVEFKPLSELLAQQHATVAEQTGTFTLFDSCHDRTNTRHGRALRALLAENGCTIREMEHCGKNTLCCGAGGAVSAFAPELSARRVTRVLDEGKATTADTLVSACPTCTYTLAQELLNKQWPFEQRNYLELVFGERVDWSAIFERLQAMWTGEYGEWVCQQLL
ncbi:MAG: (Fe-S)-binding protein [Coriobacteriales bacterium]|jgi:Fe-S oxidoreductase|nr:(Fe-S)-binding protein [Coriobacteriales bacterium]